MPGISAGRLRQYREERSNVGTSGLTCVRAPALAERLDRAAIDVSNLAGARHRHRADQLVAGREQADQRAFAHQQIGGHAQRQQRPDVLRLDGVRRQDRRACAPRHLSTFSPVQLFTSVRSSSAACARPSPPRSRPAAAFPVWMTRPPPQARRHPPPGPSTPRPPCRYAPNGRRAECVGGAPQRPSPIARQRAAPQAVQRLRRDTPQLHRRTRSTPTRCVTCHHRAAPRRLHLEKFGHGLTFPANMRPLHPSLAAGTAVSARHTQQRRRCTRNAAPFAFCARLSPII